MRTLPPRCSRCCPCAPSARTRDPAARRAQEHNAGRYASAPRPTAIHTPTPTNERDDAISAITPLAATTLSTRVRLTLTSVNRRTSIHAQHAVTAPTRTVPSAAPVAPSNEINSTCAQSPTQSMIVL